MKIWITFIVMCLAVASFCGEESPQPRTTYFMHHLNTIFPQADETDKDYVRARNVAKGLKYGSDVSSSIQNSNRNPNCCFWMELWRHDRSSYLLRIGPWGGHLTAGSPESLKTALDFMETLRGKTENGDPTYPIGIYSNTTFHTVDGKTEFKLDGSPTVVWPHKWPVCMLDPDKVDELTRRMTPVLNDFAKEFGFAEVKHAGVNPENCFWLEHWNYSRKSWVLRISDSAPGVHLVAGSTEMLQEALAFIRKNAKKSEQGWILPVGNFTNLTVRSSGKGLPQ